jgi:hypothetical protein
METKSLAFPNFIIFLFALLGLKNKYLIIDCTPEIYNIFKGNIQEW